MNESAPNPLHQQMIEAVSQAQLAAHAGPTNREPSFGQPAGPQIQYIVNRSGRIPSEIVKANTTVRHGDNGSTSTYEAQLEWPSGHPGQAEGKVKIIKTSPNGETSQRIVRNPDTARRFAAHIGNHATRRAVEASQRNENLA